MGTLLKSRRSLTIGGARLLAPLLVTFALTYGATPALAAPQAGTATESVESSALRIEALKLDDASSHADLEVVANSPLVWTSFWDSEGRLVVELPNSQPEPSVSTLTPGSGLVSSVEVALEQGTWQPITRLTVATRRDVEHSLVAEGNTLRLRLTPVDGGEDAAQVADAGSYEPLPASGADDTEMVEVGGDEEPTLAEVDLGEGAAPQKAAVVSTEPEVEHVEAQGRRATVLEGVEVVSTLGGTTIRVAGDGEFSYESFQLENPARFVVDLTGVVNASSRSTVPVASNTVQRVRIAQFKPFPDPVSRVVFDLEGGQQPVVRRTDAGLLVSFGSGAQAEVGTPPAASPASAETVEMAAAEPVMEMEETAEPEESTSVAAVVSTEPEPMAMEPEATELMAEDDSAVMAQAETTAVPMPANEPMSPPATADDGVEMAVVTPVVDEPEPAMIEPESGDEMAMAESESAAAADVMEQPAAMTETPVVAEVPPLPEVRPEAAAELHVVGASDQAATSDVALFEAADVSYQQPSAEVETIEPSKPSPEVVGAGGRVYSGRPITMSLKDADIKDVLRTFSKITGLNVVLHPSVRGSVTVELTDVPWDQALDLILKINGLDYVLEGNIMRIASAGDLQKEAEARRRLAAARASEIPLQTVIRAVSYAQASQIARLLTSGGTGGSRSSGQSRAILSSRGTITVDQRTNKLIIKELPSNMSTVLAIIDNLDTAEPQVLIEARIVETTKSFSRTLGINWGFNAVSDAQFGNTTGLAFPNHANANGGVNLLTGGNNGFLDITLGNVLDTFTLDLSLQAAENEGLVSILSAPKIATLNNQKASIQSGLQIPIQTVANNTVSVQFVNATLQLEVTPQVTAEGTVMMDINLAKREPQLAFAIAGAANAPISTKQARTRVIVRDGGTTVIGGIYEVSNNRGEDRVPGLANVPILGHLFKNKRRNIDNEELLIFITPRVIQL
ncbi:MAG: type IV pilus secretin PilQ [Acidobacteria bacterium]|nr:type IV pilus secretin PilQ [Acidobacteriota bacterium]